MGIRRVFGVAVLAAVAVACGGPKAAPAARPTVQVGSGAAVVAVATEAELRYVRGVAAIGRAYRRMGDYLLEFLDAEKRAYALGTINAADHVMIRTEVKYLALHAGSYLDTLKYSLDGGQPATFDPMQAEKLFAAFAIRVASANPSTHTELSMRAERVRVALFVLGVMPLDPRPDGVAVAPMPAGDDTALRGLGAEAP